MFVGGFIRITVHVYVHALHFLFPTSLCEALQLVYFGVTEALSHRHAHCVSGLWEWQGFLHKCTRTCGMCSGEQCWDKQHLLLGSTGWWIMYLTEFCFFWFFYSCYWMLVWIFWRFPRVHTACSWNAKPYCRLDLRKTALIPRARP